MPKGFLISYAGYPYSPSCLMPDNGLASLAAVLLRDGHEVTILDYGTVAVLDRLMPRRISLRLGTLFDMASNSQVQSPFIAPGRDYQSNQEHIRFFSETAAMHAGQDNTDSPA